MVKMEMKDGKDGNIGWKNSKDEFNKTFISNSTTSIVNNF